MTKNPPKVFIDANALIGAGKPPGGPEIARVIELVDAGLATILTTDLTIMEVAKKHATDDFELISAITQPHFRKAVEAHTGIKLEDLKRADLREKVNKSYVASTRKMMKSLKATELKVDDVKPSTVLSAYSSGTGFFSGIGKKDQFPDAFAFEALKAGASAKQPIIIVSADKDFVAPAAGEEHVSLVKSFPDLFAHLGLQIEAPEVEDWLEDQKDELVSLVDSELADWGLQGDVEDSEIEETNVNAVEILKVTAFSPTGIGDPILVIATLRVTATASYSHPDWDTAMWDSEDKVAYAFESVSGEAEVDLKIDISMTIMVDEDGKPAEVEQLNFRNGDFQFVELHPSDPWEYK
jgi:hypothetical protein